MKRTRSRRELLYSVFTAMIAARFGGNLYAPVEMVGKAMLVTHFRQRDGDNARSSCAVAQVLGRYRYAIWDRRYERYSELEDDTRW